MARAAAPAADASYSELALGGAWALTSPKRKGTWPITLPGDVHTALLDAGGLAGAAPGE
jgi:beta-mannosidase